MPELLDITAAAQEPETSLLTHSEFEDKINEILESSRRPAKGPGFGALWDGLKQIVNTPPKDSPTDKK